MRVQPLHMRFQERLGILYVRGRPKTLYRPLTSLAKDPEKRKMEFKHETGVSWSCVVSVVYAENISEEELVSEASKNRWTVWYKLYFSTLRSRNVD